MNASLVDLGSVLSIEEEYELNCSMAFQQFEVDEGQFTRLIAVRYFYLVSRRPAIYDDPFILIGPFERSWLLRVSLYTIIGDKCELCGRCKSRKLVPPTSCVTRTVSNHRYCIVPSRWNHLLFWTTVLITSLFFVSSFIDGMMYHVFLNQS